VAVKIPARHLARTSARGKVLHIIEWRRTEADRQLSLCNDGLTLMSENGDMPVTLPICKMCLKAEEAIRAVVTFADIKVNRLDIEGLTIAQIITAALQHSVPHHAVIEVDGGCSCCSAGTAALTWYTPVGDSDEQP
jgi:hypothetical protein